MSKQKWVVVVVGGGVKGEIIEFPWDQSGCTAWLDELGESAPLIIHCPFHAASVFIGGAWETVFFLLLFAQRGLRKEKSEFTAGPYSRDLDWTKPMKLEEFTSAVICSQLWLASQTTVSHFMSRSGPIRGGVKGHLSSQLVFTRPVLMVTNFYEINSKLLHLIAAPGLCWQILNLIFVTQAMKRIKGFFHWDVGTRWMRLNSRGEKAQRGKTHYSSKDNVYCHFTWSVAPRTWHCLPFSGT